MTRFLSLDRRNFLAGTAALALAAPARSETDKKMLILNSLGGIDDPDMPVPEEAAAVLTPRSIADAHASGLTAVNVTLGYVMGDKQPYDSTVKDIAWWDEAIAQRSTDLIKVLNADDILSAQRSGRIGIIYGFQNSTMMEGKPERVDFFAARGVRIVQLTYNPKNDAGCGSTAPENCGLTPWGHVLVERLNAKQLIVDLSHSGEQICLDAARHSKAPICISHTGCRALHDHPRNKTDAELRLVAERGGYVGIYFMLYLNASGRATAADVAAHIEHAVNICGEDHVGIGTDGSCSTYADMAAYMAELKRDVERRKALGVGAPGEAADKVPFVMDLRGPTQFTDLAHLLAKRGHPERRIEKILGLNFVTYARSVWQG